MTDEEKLLKAKLLKALEKLYEKDGELLKIEASERSIAFRLGIYLDELFRNTDLIVDCEYNREGDIPKELRGKNIYPDLIVHKRKIHEGNRMILEIKSGERNNNKRFNNDKEKLEAFTEEKPYEYKIGAHIFITSKVCDIAWYKTGKVERIDFYTIDDNKFVPMSINPIFIKYKKNNEGEEGKEIDFYFIGNNKCMPVDIDPIAKHYLEAGHYLAKFYLSPKGSKGADQ